MKFKDSYFSHSLVLFSFYFSMGIFSSMLAIYLDNLGKSPKEISFIISGNYIFAFVMVPTISFLYDKFDESKFLTHTILLLSATCAIIFALSRHIWILFIFNGLCLSLLQSIAPICERLCSFGRYQYGSIRVWGAVGYAIAAQTAGIIYQYLDPFFLFILYGITICTTVLGFINTGNIQKSQHTNQSQIKKRSLFRFNKNFILFLFSSFIFSGITGLSSTYVPMLIVERGSTISHAGTTIFLATMMEIPLILLSSKFMDSFNDKKLILSAFIMLILQFSIYAFSNTYIPVIITCVLLKSVTTMLYIMITMKIIQNVIDVAHITFALGITATIKSFGSIFFQNMGGIFIENNGLTFLYIILTIFATIGFLISLVIKIKGNKNIFQ